MRVAETLLFAADREPGRYRGCDGCDHIGGCPRRPHPGEAHGCGRARGRPGYARSARHGRDDARSRSCRGGGAFEAELLPLMGQQSSASPGHFAGLSSPCNFILSKSSSGYFAISSNNIVTVWSGSVVPGSYPVRVRAVGINTRFSGSATFIVNVIAPSLPTPTGVTFVTKMTSLPRQFARRDSDRHGFRIDVRWLGVRWHARNQPSRHCCDFRQHAAGARTRAHLGA